jgi:release factor glutamine methyltransferase
LKIQDLINQAAEELALSSNTPRLDIELLLQQVLDKPRVYIYSHPEQCLTEQQLSFFNRLLARRVTGEPMAYITGHKEFWSLNLVVSPAVLIPRPDTELLVDLALKKYSANENLICADLGTGSGAIALALASERPNWEIIATDKFKEAIATARNNAQRLGIDNVEFYQGNWCRALPVKKYNLIISNPPYIAKNDPHLKSDIKFEPKAALVAGADGLDAIRNIIAQAKTKLAPKGILMLEHGYNQAAMVGRLLADHGYVEINTHKDLSGHERVTVGSLFNPPY